MRDNEIFYHFKRALRSLIYDCSSHTLRSSEKDCRSIMCLCYQITKSARNHSRKFPVCLVCHWICILVKTLKSELGLAPQTLGEIISYWIILFSLLLLQNRLHLKLCFKKILLSTHWVFASIRFMKENHRTILIRRDGQSSPRVHLTHAQSKANWWTSRPALYEVKHISLCMPGVLFDSILSLSFENFEVCCFNSQTKIQSKDLNNFV